MSCQLKMEDTGRIYDVAITRDAVAFLKECPDFIDKWLSQVKDIKSKGRMQFPGKQNSLGIYQALGMIGSSLPLESLANVDKNHKHLLVSHSKEVFCAETSKSSWKSHGTLSKVGQNLLDTLVPWIKDTKFNNQMIKHGGYTCLSNLLSACPVESMCVDFLETLLMMCNNATINLYEEKRIVELDTAGILPFIIEISAHKNIRLSGLAVPILNKILDDLKLIRLCFTKESVCGKALKKACAKSHGREIDRLLMQLSQKSMMSKNLLSDNNKAKPSVSRMCRQCSKVGQTFASGETNRQQVDKMLRCSRCRSTYYCSKECQKKDWAKHKVTCEPGGREDKASTYNMMMNMLHIYHKFFKGKLAALSQMDVSTERGSAVDGSRRGRPFKDMAIRMDFITQDHDVVLIEDVLKRKHLPDWFYSMEKNIGPFLVSVEDYRSRLLKNQLLVLARFSMCDSAVYRVVLPYFNEAEITSGSFFIDSLADMMSSRHMNEE